MKLTHTRFALFVALTSAVLTAAGMAFDWPIIQTLIANLSTLGMVPVVGMIMDERTEFCDAVSVAAAAGTTLIGDVIDLTVARNLFGADKPLYLVITVDTEIITGGAAGTLELILASDAQAAIAVDGTETHHWISRKFVTDDAGTNDAILNAGGILACVPLPGEGAAYERYLGILARVGTTTITAGKVNAFLTSDPQQWKAYADGV